jgi:hypothetical protein
MPKALEIHPAIGIARVGNSTSETDFFLGPEPGVTPPAKYRDSTGSYKRQAARFRVFECERDNKGILLKATELTPAQGQITWTAHLVNRKGAAPNFFGKGNRNNSTGDDAKDKDLIIDPGARTLTGPDQGPAMFDTGKFMNVVVPLGSIRTDKAARLIVLGGFGKSGSVPPHKHSIKNFADSDGWHDDASDGPIRAKITLAATGKVVEAKPAWVIVTPPDFAPGISNLITLYDAIYEVAVERGFRTVPKKPSFIRHIQPVLGRAVGYRWVNAFNRMGHGPGRSGDFAAEWSELADPATAKDVAPGIVGLLRDPNKAAPKSPDSSAMPRLKDETDSKQVLPLTKTQYAVLKQWEAGNYVNDLGQSPPAELLPDALDRMALEACAGGPFYPGIEAGAIMKRKEIYTEAFRVNAEALKPGQITQGNALPWQADFFDCTFDAEDSLGWWPAQRPDQVRPEADPSKTEEWVRGVHTKLEMTSAWHHLGIVVRKAGPPEIFVETERDPAFVPK